MWDTVSQLMKLKAHINMPLFLIECQKPEDKLHSNAVHVQVFHDDDLKESITNSRHVIELTDCPAMALKDEFNEFSHII